MNNLIKKEDRMNMMMTNTDRKRRLSSCAAEDVHECKDIGIISTAGISIVPGTSKDHARVVRKRQKLEGNEIVVDDTTHSDFKCCGIHRRLNPVPIQCPVDNTFINAGDTYFKAEKDDISICEGCYNRYRKRKKNRNIEVNEKSLSTSEFGKLKLEPNQDEPSVFCKECNSRFHQVCVLHCPEICPVYICRACSISLGLGLTRPCSSDIPRNCLSDFMQKRLDDFLTEEKWDHDITIRVVVCEDKVVMPGGKIKNRYGDKVPNEGFPYRAKTIFAFQKCEDGTEVAFFAFVCHEFYQNCPPPNRGNIYLAYLDSVNMNRPKEWPRTEVYHTILLGYLRYMQLSGFRNVFLWSCPTNQFTGRDYIFYCHPPTMKFPRAVRLYKWYKALFDKAISEGFAVQYQNLCEYIDKEDISAVWDIPYFEGDEWPKCIENILGQEDKKITKIDTLKKGAKKKGDTKFVNFLSKHPKVDKIMANVAREIFIRSNSFMVLRLQKGTTQDLIERDGLMSYCSVGRDDFMEMCIQRGYQFSDTFHCRRSTMFLLSLAISGFQSTVSKEIVLIKAEEQPKRDHNFNILKPGDDAFLRNNGADDEDIGDSSEDEDIEQGLRMLCHGLACCCSLPKEGPCIICRKLIYHLKFQWKRGLGCKCAFCETISSAILYHGARCVVEPVCPYLFCGVPQEVSEVDVEMTA